MKILQHLKGHIPWGITVVHIIGHYSSNSGYYSVLHGVTIQRFGPSHTLPGTQPWTRPQGGSSVCTPGRRRQWSL